MKKIMLYFIGFIFLCFILPAIFTKSNVQVVAETTNNINVQEEQKQIENYNYQKYGKVKLLHSKTGEVEEVNLDDYLVNVVSAEMLKQ